MSKAVINSNLVDLRAKPDFRSERVNQALWGEIVQTGPTRAGWVRVAQEDGYRGWIDRRFLSTCSTSALSRYAARRNYLVTAEKTPVRDSSGRVVPPYFVYYGTILTVTRQAGGRCVYGLPAGPTFGIGAHHVARLRDIERTGVTAGMLLREARRFLGVPYLWGGISPAGFDCSGFVRAIFGRFGIRLPRDTRDQIKVGTEVERVNVRPGDLLFFPRHVGIALRYKKMVHASLGAGGVAINSLRRGDDDYRKDLDDSFVTARRLL